MQVLIDYFKDLIQVDGLNVVDTMRVFVNEVEDAWRNAKEGSQFLFTVQIEGTRSYYFRRRKFNPKHAVLEQRRCQGKNVWLFNRQ